MNPGQFECTDSAKACQDNCKQTPGCNFWTWTPDFQNACWKKSSKGEVRPESQAISGPAQCGNMKNKPSQHNLDTSDEENEFEGK